MILGGDKHNFGRVIYLTFIRDITNQQLQSSKFTSKQLEEKGAITICFDPKRDPQLHTRIDFYVKHMGEVAVGNNGVYTTANIDVYNIGPGLQQFFDAYNAYKFDGHFKDVHTKKFAVVLQVGYEGGAKTTIFAGHISSFVVDRQQNNSNVDNVWHFFCQYPSPQQDTTAGVNRATSGEDYSKIEYWNPQRSVPSWEEYLKQAIMAHDRVVYSLESIITKLEGDSFEVSNKAIDYIETLKSGTKEEELMCVSPHTEKITPYNFDKNYTIEYRVSKRSKLLEKTKQYWQQKVGISTWNINTANLQQTVSSIARATNCHSRIELDENTGHQTIYIYPAGWPEEVVYKGKADFVITDYQGLRKPPQVAANMLSLDMMMEPSMRPGNTVELRISDSFLATHPHPTFEPSFSMSNTATVFAGASFIGLAQLGEEDKKKNAIASVGNIFNSQFVATIVEFRGSSHSAEWSTKVDCYGIVVNGTRRTV